MMFNRFLPVIALSSILLVGAPACATAQDEVIRTARTEQPALEAREQHSLKPTVSTAQLFDQISDTLDAAAAAWSSGDIDAVMQHYSVDQPLLVLYGDEPLKGPEPLRAWLEAQQARPGGLGTMNYEWFETLQLDDYTAVTSGRMIITVNGQHHRALFTRLLRRSTDGWQILHDQIALPASL
ncbi:MULTISPECIES: YybH family protein [unclassified Brevundimonas]|uniref:YybH family protein n=1 Tax=unclassified Brevundimonas TaxID=2622653 RepID=UPI0025C5D5FD|nr:MULTISPECIES: nuclear transport factor 2 family protein [unclassified Brevundimonas]